MNDKMDKIENDGVGYKGVGNFFRIVLVFGVLIALLLGVILIGTSWWVLRRTGPEVWVALLEDNCNCRGQVDDARLSLFPTKLIFEGVKIARKDAEVGKPLSERVPLAEGAAPIVIPKIVLELELDDLFAKRLFIQRMKVVSPEIIEQQDEQGLSTLETLFHSASTGTSAPGTRAGKATIVSTVPATMREYKTPKSAPQSSPSGYAFAINEALLESGRLTIASKNTTVHLTDLNITLDGIDVSAIDPGRHNRIHANIRSRIQVEGLARIGGVKRPAELANLQLSGQGTMIPFNLKTHAWEPSTTLKLTLASDSVLAGHITMGDVAGKEMKKLQEYGVDLAPVQIGGALMVPAIIEGLFTNNRFTLLTAARFAFPEYEVLIEENSWINGVQDQHEMDLHLSCGGALQARLKQGVANAKLGDALSHSVVNALLDKRGRMTFDIESKGSLADPQVRPKLDRVLKNLISGENLGNLLQGLLKKL